MANKKAVPRLLEMLKAQPEVDPDRRARARQDRRRRRDRERAAARSTAPRPTSASRRMSALARLADDRSHRRRAREDPAVHDAHRPVARGRRHPRAHRARHDASAASSVMPAPGTLTQAAAAARADQQRTHADRVRRRLRDHEAGRVAAAARHRDAEARRRDRGPLQVHRAHRPRRLRHRAADGGHGRRRAAGAQVPEPEHLPGRGDDAALRARAALQPQDHAPERHPHLRLPAHPRQLRDLDGVLPVAHAGRRGLGRQAAGAAPRRAARHGRRQGHDGRARRSASCTAT